MNMLEQLEEISSRREDGGLFHGGHIHFIQQKVSDETEFTLKAAIYGVLENVPENIPADLPELVAADPGFKPSERTIACFNKINDGLIMPLSGFEVLEIIKAAREYIELAKADKQGVNG